MKRDPLLVVGDVFKDFADHCGAVVHGELNAQLELHELAGRSFLLGQGLSANEAAAVAEYLSSRGARAISDEMDRRADGFHSHKRKEANTLIGTPQMIGEGRYRAPMLVDAGSELMSDHQTGLHLQGMLQVEAYRQFMLALFEVFHPLPEGQKSYAVINKMEVSFETFMFPLPAAIEASIEHLDVNDRRTRISTQMQAMQNGQACSQCVTTFTYYPADVISAKEAALALKATHAAFAETTTPVVQAVGAMPSAAVGQVVAAQSGA